MFWRRRSVAVRKAILLCFLLLHRTKRNLNFFPSKVEKGEKVKTVCRLFALRDREETKNYYQLKVNEKFLLLKFIIFGFFFFVGLKTNSFYIKKMNEYKKSGKANYY